MARETPTLFDEKVYQRKRFRQFGQLYSIALQLLARGDDTKFHDSEKSIFDDLARTEASLIEGGTMLSGPLMVSVDKRTIDCSRGRPKLISGWTEPPRLRFRSCSAKGIVLIEKGTPYCRLAATRVLQKSKLLLVCGNGIPRLDTRRILHRLQSEFHLPVYVFADNDTWGYFMFSALKRGSIVPHISYPESAVKDVRYIGLRAGDPPQPMDRSKVATRFKEQWSPRVRAMLKYSCFRSATWQRELKTFLQQRSKVEMDGIANYLHEIQNGESVRVSNSLKYLCELILDRIKRREWLS
jgi:DNA topoisomerase VI subunit A